jgi:hypothetical protein
MDQHRAAGAGEIPQVWDDDAVAAECSGGLADAAFEPRDVHEFGSGDG